MLIRCLGHEVLCDRRSLAPFSSVIFVRSIPFPKQLIIRLSTGFREIAQITDYIVCGWYTSDYSGWASRLEQSLVQHGQPFDLVKVDKPIGEGWETTTMRKAGEVLKALDRHPSKTLIFIDVDCQIAGDLAPLSKLRGDVAFYFHPRRRRSGFTKAHIRSGTIVLRPTAEARRFVERWAEISSRAQYGDVDQDALLLAINTPCVLFEQLEVKWCFTKSDKCKTPVICHSSASKNRHKISTTKRRVVSFAKWMLGKSAVWQTGPKAWLRAESASR